MFLEPKLEDTLIGASLAGMEGGDLRVLGILTTWLEVHRSLVNADRLVRAVGSLDSRRSRAYWAACGQWLREDRRLRRLQDLYEGPRIDVLPFGTAFLVQRHGEDSRFEHTDIRVPRPTLRQREEDVLPPAELVRRHRTAHYRVLIGPSYRADMWATLERDPDLSAAELARTTYGSFATAWQVKKDWELLISGSKVIRSNVDGRARWMPA